MALLDDRIPSTTLTSGSSRLTGAAGENGRGAGARVFGCSAVAARNGRWSGASWRNANGSLWRWQRESERKKKKGAFFRRWCSRSGLFVMKRRRRADSWLRGRRNRAAARSFVDFYVCLKTEQKPESEGVTGKADMADFSTRKKNERVGRQ